MTEPANIEITEEAVEAVMDVIWRPEHASEERLGQMRCDAREALEAALPHLRVRKDA